MYKFRIVQDNPGSELYSILPESIEEHGRLDKGVSSGRGERCFATDHNVRAWVQRIKSVASLVWGSEVSRIEASNLVDGPAPASCTVCAGMAYAYRSDSDANPSNSSTLFSRWIDIYYQNVPREPAWKLPEPSTAPSWFTRPPFRASWLSMSYHLLFLPIIKVATPCHLFTADSSPFSIASIRASHHGIRVSHQLVPLWHRD